jgi:hypothetical protein
MVNSPLPIDTVTASRAGRSCHWPPLPKKTSLWTGGKSPSGKQTVASRMKSFNLYVDSLAANMSRLTSDELGVLPQVRAFLSTNPLPAGTVVRGTLEAPWSEGYHQR